MRFNRLIRPSFAAAPAYLAAVDRFVVAAGRTALHVALAGVILTGLLLEFFDSMQTPIPYSALKGLHWIFALILLIDLLRRVFRLVFRFFASVSAVAALGRRGAAKWRGFIMPAPRHWLAAGFWSALLLMMISGLEQALKGGYGISLIPFRPPLPWITIHEIASSYLLAALLMRWFFWGKAYLRKVVPYLRSP